jgi:hypothetical protein
LATPSPENETLFSITKAEDLVKSLKLPIFVIPAKAGIQFFQVVTTSLDSGFHRSDDFLRNHQKGRPDGALFVFPMG